MGPADLKLDETGRANIVKYITLVNCTDQGIKSVKEAPDRIDAVRALAKKLGCEMTDFNMTVGAYDIVATMEASDNKPSPEWRGHSDALQFDIDDYACWIGRVM